MTTTRTPPRTPASEGTYTCADCGGTFPKGWSDEEAAAESIALFGVLAPDDQVVVCDDCFNGIRDRAAAVGEWPSASTPDARP